MADGPSDPQDGELTPRDPSLADLLALARQLFAAQGKIPPDAWRFPPFANCSPCHVVMSRDLTTNSFSLEFLPSDATTHC